MKKIILFLAAMLFCCCSADSEMKAQNMEQKMYITIGGQTQSVTLVDNDATRELVAALQDAPITVTLNDNNFEIWGALGRSLTTKNEQMTAQPGDVVLYNGSNICIFYASNSWSYTRLGHIDGLSESELRTFLKAGQNNISVTLSLAETTGINTVKIDKLKDKSCYTLQGTLAQAGHKGIIIQNGKKIISFHKPASRLKQRHISRQVRRRSTGCWKRSREDFSCR